MRASGRGSRSDENGDVREMFFVRVHIQRSRIVRRDTAGEDADRDQIVRKLEFFAQYLRIEPGDKGAAEFHLVDLEHHLGHNDGGIDHAVILTVEGAFPGFIAVVADDKEQWGVEVTFGGALDFFPADVGKENKYPLGLTVAGGRGVAGNFEDLFDLYFRDRFIFEAAHRIAFQSECGKVHNFLLEISFRL